MKYVTLNTDRTRVGVNTGMISMTNIEILIAQLTAIRNADELREHVESLYVYDNHIGIVKEMTAPDGVSAFMVLAYFDPYLRRHEGDFKTTALVFDEFMYKIGDLRYIPSKELTIFPVDSNKISIKED